MCNECLLGVELGEKEGNVIELFAAGADFLKRPRGYCQETVKALALIQLNKFSVMYDHIYCEPELIYLKRFLYRSYPRVGHRPLFIVHRKIDPILTRPLSEHDQILHI